MQTLKTTFHVKHTALEGDTIGICRGGCLELQ